MNPWRVIAFHTDDDIYNKAVERLRVSLINLKITYMIKTIPHAGTWKKTCLSIHQHILDALDTFPENIVYLDADAIVRQYPVLFDTLDCDIAVHYKGGSELLVGTTFLKNCDKVKQLVKDWMYFASIGEDLLSPQTGIVKALEKDNYNVYKLPAPYTLIFDNMKNEGPAVIEHFQASREVKDKC